MKPKQRKWMHGLCGNWTRTVAPFTSGDHDVGDADGLERRVSGAGEMTDQLATIEGDCFCGERYELTSTPKRNESFKDFWWQEHRECHTREHDRLIKLMVRRPEDFAPWGEADRDVDGGPSPDCSSGCKWARRLEPPLDMDWLVCTNPKSHRCGLLTFEHQAGGKCFESKEPM